jgi:hypothetical protein
MKYPFLALVLTVSVCASSRAQTGDKRLRPEGTEAFRSILHHFKLQPAPKPGKGRTLNPVDTLIVIFGSSKLLDWAGLDQFRKDGGALLIATDRTGGSQLKGWGWQIPGSMVEDQREPYRGERKCPRVVPVRDHPVFEGIRQGIATNSPSFLQASPGKPPRASSLDTLAMFPGTALVGGQPRDPLPFMVGSADPDRVLVLAGHGVFMNMLLAQTDNDNITFAFNCVRWLSQARDGGKRRYVLFIENGRRIEDFDSGLIQSPRLPLPPTQMVNRMIRGLEEENFFNRLLLELFKRKPIMRAVVLLCSLILLLYGGWKLMGARQRSETPVLTTSLVANGPETPVLSQRRSALTEKGNFAEPAAGLVRSFFAEYTLPSARTSLPGSGGALSFQAQGPWWRRRFLMRQIDYLRRIETGQAGRVSARELRRLPAILDHVAAAIRNGRLTVNGEGQA